MQHRAFPSTCSPRTRPVAPPDVTRTPRGADNTTSAQYGCVLEGDRSPSRGWPDYVGGTNSERQNTPGRESIHLLPSLMQTAMPAIPPRVPPVVPRPSHGWTPRGRYRVQVPRERVRRAFRYLHTLAC